MSKDTATKQYFSDNERFADIFNYLIYDGERVIYSDNLKERDSTELFQCAVDDEIISEQKYRDLLKRCIIKECGDEIYILLGIENQENVHYAMPLRNNLYDLLNYAKQAQRIANRHKKEKDLRGAEFLSGFSKEDRIVPVVTLVIYWSPDEWDGPTSLYDMFSVDHKEILKYVNDYKINIIEPCKIENTGKFVTDLKCVMDFIKVSKDKNGMKRLLNDKKEEFSKMATDAAMVINECAKVNLSIDETEEKVNMCKAWEDMAQEVREETAKEVEAQMCKAWEDMAQEVREETEYNTIYKLYTKGKLTLEEAMEETCLSEEEFLAKIK